MRVSNERLAQLAAEAEEWEGGYDTPLGDEERLALDLRDARKRIAELEAENARLRRSASDEEERAIHYRNVLSEIREVLADHKPPASEPCAPALPCDVCGEEPR